MYTPRQSAVMCWGKIRRAFLVGLAPKKAAAKLAHRHGACARCGACCKILFHCPSLDCSNGNPRCLVYDDRPGVCSHFPLDPADLRDRDLVMPDTQCGFHFNGTVNGNGNGNGSHDALGRTGNLRGTWAIFRSIFRRPNGHV